MRIAYCSDIHCEFHAEGWIPPLPVNVDVFILAGDIAIGRSTLSVLEKISNAMPDTKILFVAGNHEYYGTSVDIHVDTLRLSLASSSQIHFLEKSAIVIDGITFLGCSLWSGFDVLGEAGFRFVVDGAGSGLTDFRAIKNRSGGEMLHPRTMAHFYRESRLWLENHLKVTDPEKTVVITHWPPCRGVRNRAIPEDLISAYFQSNCQDLIETYQPRYWVYGHNHWSDTVKIGRTTLLSNQGGYPSEGASIPGYDRGRYFEIDAG